MPLITIVLPVFNRAKNIRSTLNSVFNQNFKDYELIVVDDGSTDDLKLTLSTEIVNKSLFYVYQPNQGVSSARNTGSLHAKGQYLIFLDSDDIVNEKWLFDYNNVIQKDYPDIIYCGINRVQDQKIVSYTNPKDPYGNNIDYGNVIPGSFCIKSSFFHMIGRYDSFLAYGENTELGFRIKMNNPTFGFIDEPNLNYIMHQNSHGKNSFNKMNGIIYILKKHEILFSSNSDLRQKYLSIAGVAAVKCNEYKIAKKLFLDILIISPFNLLNILRFVIVNIPLLRNKIWN